MPLDHGLRTGTGVEFYLVLIAVWVWEAGKEGRMLLTLPEGQDHSGHLRKAGVVLLLIGGRVQVPIPSPI